MKVGFDLSLVLIASLLSLLFLGQLAGVREGTAAAALCVGLCAKGISRLLAERMHGELHAESAPGQGTRFILTLAAAALPEEERPPL